jgi:hypothetical protein
MFLCPPKSRLYGRSGCKSSPPPLPSCFPVAPSRLVSRSGPVFLLVLDPTRPAGASTLPDPPGSPGRFVLPVDPFRAIRVHRSRPLGESGSVVALPAAPPPFSAFCDFCDWLPPCVPVFPPAPGQRPGLQRNHPIRVPSLLPTRASTIPDPIREFRVIRSWLDPDPPAHRAGRQPPPFDPMFLRLHLPFAESFPYCGKFAEKFSIPWKTGGSQPPAPSATLGP